MMMQTGIYLLIIPHENTIEHSPYAQVPALLGWQLEIPNLVLSLSRPPALPPSHKVSASFLCHFY